MWRKARRYCSNVSKYAEKSFCHFISSTFWAFWPIPSNITGESHNPILHHKWCLRPMTFIVSRCRQLQRASAIALKKWIEKGSMMCQSSFQKSRPSRSELECWKVLVATAATRGLYTRLVIVDFWKKRPLVKAGMTI